MNIFPIVRTVAGKTRLRKGKDTGKPNSSESRVMTLWRVELGAGEMGDGAVGDDVSSGYQHLPVRKQRRSVEFAAVVHMPGATKRPRGPRRRKLR